MTLPLTRNETAAPSSQVKSATTNDLQDAIINARHGSVVVPWSAAQAAIQAVFTRVATGFINAGASSALAYVTMALPVGAKITAADISGIDAAGSSFGLELFKLNLSTGARVSKSDAVASNSSGTNQTVPLTNVIEETLGATEVWQLEIAGIAAANSSTVYGGTITVQVE